MKTCLIPYLFFIVTLTASSATVDTVTIHSGSMHKEIRCVVIVPEKQDGRFPVVYLLHGYSDNYATWVTNVPSIKIYADRMNIMIVCPDGGFSSWYYDSPVDSTMKYETHIIREVLPFIDSHYPTIPDRSHRAIVGHSMGGHGALYLALKHTGLFGAAGSMSGGVDIRPFKRNWDLQKRLGDTVTYAAQWDSMTVITMIDRYPARTLAMMIDCGTGDFFHTVNKHLHEKLLSLNIPHDYIERPGQHSWNYWTNAIEYQLIFFSNYFSRNPR